MKLCVDCKLMISFELDLTLSKCGRPSGIIDVVTGGSKPLEVQYCSIQRHDGWFWARVMHTCGEEGRFFEAKP
jgi:hypothetical protein